MWAALAIRTCCLSISKSNLGAQSGFLKSVLTEQCKVLRGRLMDIQKYGQLSDESIEKLLPPLHERMAERLVT